MSPTVISVAKLQLALRMALTSASRTGWTLFSLAPTTSWPSVLLSMPMTSGEIWDGPVRERRLRRPLDVEADRGERGVDDVEDRLRNRECAAEPGQVDRHAGDGEGADEERPRSWSSSHRSAAWRSTAGRRGRRRRCRGRSARRPTSPWPCGWRRCRWRPARSTSALGWRAAHPAPRCCSRSSGTPRTVAWSRWRPRCRCPGRRARSAARRCRTGSGCRSSTPPARGAARRSAGTVGADPSQPSASIVVPMVPRSIVWESDCPSMSWKFAIEVASVMA